MTSTTSFPPTSEVAKIMGYGSSHEIRWVFETLPTGRVQPPVWAKGLLLDFMLQYGNDPGVKLLAAPDVFDFKECLGWRKNGSCYSRVNPDGRASFHYHGGKVFREGDRWVTTREEGYGGRGFKIKMHPESDFMPGEDVVLRGPWHGAPPRGYLEMTVLGTHLLNRPLHLQPWKKRMGVFGLCVTDTLFLQLMARFLPHLRVARVWEGGFESLQPLLPHWEAPKAVERVEWWGIYKSTRGPLTFEQWDAEREFYYWHSGAEGKTP